MKKKKVSCNTCKYLLNKPHMYGKCEIDGTFKRVGADKLKYCPFLDNNGKITKGSIKLLLNNSL